MNPPLDIIAELGLQPEPEIVFETNLLEKFYVTKSGHEKPTQTTS